MNDSDPFNSDPFVSLLEKSLEVPDFELSRDSRELLLAAAGGASLSPGKVVPFVKPDDEAQAAFDWLMGERSADIGLMDAMVNRPGFLETVEAEKQFTRMMRAVMRPAQTTPQVGRRKMPAVLGALAATIALLLAFSQWLPLRTPDHAVAAMMAEVPSKAVHTSAPLVSDPVHAVSLPEISVPAPVAFAPEFQSVFPPMVGPRKESPTLAADGDAPRLFDLREARTLAAKELFSEPQSWLDPLSWSGLGLESSSLAFGGDEMGGGVASARGSSGWERFYAVAYDNGAAPGTGGQGLNVPEPSTFLPILLSGFFLLLRRKRSRHTM